MSVTEQLMGWGAWDLTLRPETTPGQIWTLLDPDDNAVPTGGFGHILITPAHVDPNAVGDAGMKAVSKYTGIYRGTLSRNVLSGVGLVGWLGDEDGKGNVHETAQTGVFGGETTGSFRAWIRDVLPAAVTMGTLTAIAGTLNESMVYITPLDALNRIMEYFGGEFRVNPDGTLDAGTTADLFATTPNVILLWRGSGPGTPYGVHSSTIEIARDLDDYTTKVIVIGPETPGPVSTVGTATAGSVPFKDLHGNTVVIKRLLTVPEMKTTTNLDAVAASQLTRYDGLRRSYRLTTDEWIAVVQRGGKRLEPGDSVWVYDPRPDARLHDTANEVTYNGEVLNPIKLRLQSMTWPIEEGMGVYFRYYDGATATYVDLTPHVVWEDAETTLDVGAAGRRSTQPGPSAVQAQITQGQWHPVTAEAQDLTGSTISTTEAVEMTATLSIPANWAGYKIHALFSGSVRESGTLTAARAITGRIRLTNAAGAVLGNNTVVLDSAPTIGERTGLPITGFITGKTATGSIPFVFTTEIPADTGQATYSNGTLLVTAYRTS